MPGKGAGPCCAAAAAARLTYLVVGGHRIAISGLEDILDGAAGLSEGGEKAVRGELVRLAKMRNYVPSGAEKQYEDALFAEYVARRGGPGNDGRTEK